MDLLGAAGSFAPRIANALLSAQSIRRIAERTVGLASTRPLPRFAMQRFDRWFERRTPDGHGKRGRVVLWDDCFARHYESEIGIAAVRVLEAAGYEVELPENRACCGRPAFSLGRLDLAEEWAEHNSNTLSRVGEDVPVVFLEPSCFSMIYDDYRELDVIGADKLRARSFLFDDFLDALLARDPSALRFTAQPRAALVHGHCHAKALTGGRAAERILARVPGCKPTTLDTACCGMAGAFGALAEKYDLSFALGRLLAEKIDAAPPDAAVIASGTSCRQQIEHVTSRRPLHLAEFLAQALERGA